MSYFSWRFHMESPIFIRLPLLKTRYNQIPLTPEIFSAPQDMLDNQWNQDDQDDQDHQDDQDDPDDRDDQDDQHNVDKGDKGDKESK